MSNKSTRSRLEQVYRDRLYQAEIMAAKNMSAHSHLVALAHRDKYLKNIQELQKVRDT